jgi:periplasmic copper chaperone A
MNRASFVRLGLLSALALFSFSAALAQPAPVQAEAAWARATVPGQQATGAFVKLTARESLQLVGAASPVAGVVEIHEMRMENDIMRMRAIPALDLPAGRTVELKPGGYHVMLMDLRQPLAAQSQVPLTLVFRNAQGVESRLQLNVPVSMQAPAGQMGHGSHGHRH